MTNKTKNPAKPTAKKAPAKAPLKLVKNVHGEPWLVVDLEMYNLLMAGQVVRIACIDKPDFYISRPAPDSFQYDDAVIEGKARLKALEMLIINQDGHLELTGPALMGLAGMLEDIGNHLP